MSKPLTIALLQDADVRAAASYASSQAAEHGFSISEGAELALAVSEIAQNVIRYAGEGNATFFSPNGNGVFKVLIKDQGPGIKNLEKAMKKGFSTAKSSLGIGLDVARRSVDEFDINTDSETGTEVVLKKFLPIPEGTIQYGIVSLADERYAINGDEYLIKEYDGNKVLLAVIDGVGEGYRAHAAAMVIKDFLSTHYRLPLVQMAEECHQLLSQSDLGRGAAVAIGRVEGDTLTYLGVGDTHAYLVDDKVSHLTNFEGTVGDLQIPTLKSGKYTLNENQYLVMCTDGIKSNISFDESPDKTAQEMANSVFNEFHKTYGDVTVLVTKLLASL